MSSITLNASMRNNLLSLRNISTQMDKTQLILATGKKVNSAIDNASSYYQARSLSNRSADLNALLDGMEQGIQTIEAANVGLDKASSFLEQMQVITTQAGIVGKALSKEDLQDLLGANGAVVETAEELYAAINAGKETICVYGHIDLGNIDDAGKEITLQANQKLVGAEYFTGGQKFSSLTASATVAKNMINIAQTGCEVSDLSINYTNEAATGGVYAVRISGNNFTASNLDIKADFSDNNTSTKAAINIYPSASIALNGNINISTVGRSTHGIFSGGGTLNVCSGANLNITIDGTGGHGVDMMRSKININSGAVVDIKTKSRNGFHMMYNCNINAAYGSKINLDVGGSSGISLDSNCNLNIAEGVDIFIKSKGDGISATQASEINIAGNLFIETVSYGIFLNSRSGNTVNILSSAQIYFNTKSLEFYHGLNGGSGNNILNIAQGARLAFEKDGVAKWYKLGQDYYDENDTGKVNYITAGNVENTIAGIETTDAWVLPTAIEDTTDAKEENISQSVAAYQDQFNTSLKEYDKLLNDCGYQGINLLKGGNLKLTFDENRTHVFNISGKDISSAQLGLNEASWQTQGDLKKSIEELKNSISTIRSLAEELGNQYGVIQTRINFTSSLADILEIGADDLTLADMNEASAQYLSLQTRQQLAINSLSLAAISSRSVLSLFY